MTKTFILLFKKTIEIKPYTSLSAIFEEYSKEQLGISKFTLDRFDFSVPFENNLIRIEKTFIKTPGDIRREKQQKI